MVKSSPKDLIYKSLIIPEMTRIIVIWIIVVITPQLGRTPLLSFASCNVYPTKDQLLPTASESCLHRRSYEHHYEHE